MPGVNNGEVLSTWTAKCPEVAEPQVSGSQYPNACPVLSLPICALLAQRKWESAYEHSVARQTKPVSGGSLEKIQGTFSGADSYAQPAC